jgi:hypothetical protein
MQRILLLLQINHVRLAGMLLHQCNGNHMAGSLCSKYVCVCVFPRVIKQVQSVGMFVC